jgi:hypothetical protein
MNIHSILVFLHVLGAVGMFAVLGIETVALGRLKRADTPADVRTWMGLLAVPARFGPVTLFTTLISGIWLMVKWWGPQPWILSAFVAIVVMAVMGGSVSRRAMQRIGKALPSETGSELSAAFRSLRSNPALTMSSRLRTAIGVGILALMTMKPQVVGSLLILVAAVVAGVVAGIQSHLDHSTAEKSVLNLKGVRP